MNFVMFPLYFSSILLLYFAWSVVQGKEMLKFAIRKTVKNQCPSMWTILAPALLEKPPSIVVIHPSLPNEARNFLRSLHTNAEDTIILISNEDNNDEAEEEEKEEEEGEDDIETKNENTEESETQSHDTTNQKSNEDTESEEDSDVELEVTELFQAFAVLIMLPSNNYLQDINSALESLSESQAWTPRARHLVVLCHSEDEDENVTSDKTENDSVENIANFQHHWKNASRCYENQKEEEENDKYCPKQSEEEKALGILVELWSRQVASSVILTDALDIWWWSAQEEGGLCEGPTQKRLIHHHVFLYDEEFPFPFEKVRSPNLGGCNLTVAADVWPPYIIEGENTTTGDNITSIVDGLEFRLVVILSEVLNFEYSFYPTDISEWVSPTTYTIDGDTNFSLGAISSDEEFYIEMSPTVTYWREYGLWFVPYRVPIARWLSVGLVFSLKMWTSVFLSVIVVSLAFFVARKVVHHVDQYTNVDFIQASPDIFMLFLALLGGSAAKRPRRTITRIGFLVWSAGCIVINSAYQSALISFLAHPGYHPQFDSLEDLLNEEIIFGLDPDWKESLEIFDDPVIEAAVNRSEECVDLLPCLERTAHDRDMTVPVEPSYVDYFMPSWKTDKLIETMGDEFGAYSLATYLPKNSPLLDAFNFHIENLVQSGHFGHWWDTLLRNSKKRIELATPPVKMSIFHLQGAFFLLGLGLVMSTITFGIEQAWFRHRLRMFLWPIFHPKKILRSHRETSLPRRLVRWTSWSRLSTPELPNRLTYIQRNRALGLHQYRAWTKKFKLY